MSQNLTTHTQKVRFLYKTILKLHRGLPQDIQLLGSIYVRDEFRRHKNCNQAEAAVFINEWTVNIFDSIKIIIILIQK